jgi:hypothetical protein
MGIKKTKRLSPDAFGKLAKKADRLMIGFLLIFLAIVGGTVLIIHLIRGF